jgi:hypothetical protein
MARAKKQETNGTAVPDVDQSDVTEALLPDGVPMEEDGSASNEAEIDVDQARKIGALDLDSARLNKARAETTMRKRNGEKGVRWNDTNGLVKYEGILQVWGAQGLTIYVTRIEPGQKVDYPPTPALPLRNGQSLYDWLMRNIHRVSGPATYYVRVREGQQERGAFSLSLPDTTPQTQAVQMAVPWIAQGGYGYPGGTPQGYGGGYPMGGYTPPSAYPQPEPIQHVAAPPPQAVQPQQQQQQQQSSFVPAPPQTTDPNAQAWMGMMYQQMQELQRTLAQRLDSRGDVERLTAAVEQLRREQMAPAPMPMPAMQHHPVVPTAANGGTMSMSNPYAALAAFPKPPGWPDHLAWPPNPWASPWGPAPPPQPNTLAADPLGKVRESVELVGSLATLMDRVRGVAPHVSEATAHTVDPGGPLKPGQVETIRIGDVDVAVKPESGDIHWTHTLIGLAPKAFGFLEKFSQEVNKTVRTHDVTQAMTNGRMPSQYMPMQYQPPPQMPPQPAFVAPPQIQQPVVMQQQPPQPPPPAPSPPQEPSPVQTAAQAQQSAVRSLFT